MGPVTYQLQLPKQWKIHNVFHACLLTPYKETDEHRLNDTNPPPDLIDGEQEYEVEAIIAHRKQGRQMQYLVKWKGYNSSENTWQAENTLLNAGEILAEYKELWTLRHICHPHLSTLHLCHPTLHPYL